MKNHFRKYKLNEEFFYNETSELAYFLGYFMADGYIRHDKYRHVITFGLNAKDIHILETFKTWVDTDRPVLVYDKKKPGLHGDISTMAYFTVQSKQICEYLLNKYKINQAKTGNEIVLFKDNPTLFNSFLHGLFDGDGTVGLTKHNRALASICSASKNFLQEIRKITGLGKVRKNRGIYNWEMINNHEITKFRDLIYQDGFVGLHRKYNIFQSSNLRKFNTNFSEEDINFIKHNANKMTDREIADLLDRDYNSIQYISLKNNFRDKLVNDWSAEEIEILIEMRKNNIPFKDISQILTSHTYGSIEAKAQELRIIKDRKVSKEKIEIIRNNIELSYCELGRLISGKASTAKKYKNLIITGAI